MRHATISLLGLVLSFTWIGSASAAAISWGTPTNITGDADVSQSAGFVDGIQSWSGSSAPIVIGDATFYQPNVSAGVYSSPSGDIALTLSSSFPYPGPPNNFTGGSPSYNALVDENGNGGGTATLSGLHSGQVYQVEVWSVTYGYGQTTTLDMSVTLDSGPGQFVLGTFTATGPTQTFVYTGSDGSRISAVQLRDLSVPEPATWVLAVTAAALFSVRRRLRGQG